ncbi:MAG: tyrosine-protein phosphatase [Lachnospiraceae bacterium]|nr:tyrosine-protein phosphatase [Lachnospiraceae bacterium]
MINKKSCFRIISVFLSAVMLTSTLITGFVFADEDYEKDSIYLDTRILKVDGEGDIVLEITQEDLDNAGFSIGDQVKVRIKKYDYTEKMPYFTNDSDSESDECALIIDGDHASLSTAKSSFAEDEDLFDKKTGNDGKIVWEDYEKKNGVGESVKIYLHEKGEYLEQYQMRNPERTNDRDDYSSGRKYANFREVTAGTIGQDVLFRSSSPINKAIGRNDYAAKHMEKAGINTVINLSDSRKEVEKYLKESGNTYYKKLYDRGNVAILDLDYDFDSDAFRKGMADAVRFMSTHEAPYLIHCTEGKDRTGMLCAILEALMGASIREMTDDYLNTYKNFYHYSSDSEEYEYARKVYLRELFRAMADADSNSELSDADYHAAVLQYLKEGGAKDYEILKTIEKLKGDGENRDKVLQFRIDEKTAEEVASGDGVLRPITGARSIASFSGGAVCPGRSSLVINGDYLYNKRDYKITYKNNKHAGQMTATVKFKKKTEPYEDGIKSMVITYTIDPKEVTEDDVRIKLNKKKTEVRSVRDIERDEKIKKKYYAADMKKKRITFMGDYSGTVAFE